MTESPFPFEPTDESAVPAGDGGPGSRRPLLAALGLAAVAAVAGAVLLLGGGEDSPTETAAAPVVKRSASPLAEVPAPLLAAPPVSTTSIGLNPFKALVLEVTSTGAGAVGATTGGSGSSGGVSATVPPVPTPSPKASAKTSPAPTAPVAPVAPPAPRPAPAAPVAPVVSTVELVAITERPGAQPLGTFSYDGTRYDGEKGQVLAKKLEVIDIARLADGTWVATLRVGDGSPFKVYEDQEVVVQ